MWRDFNYAMLKHLDETYDGIIFVPMTVVNPQYFEEIIGRSIAAGSKKLVKKIV